MNVIVVGDHIISQFVQKQLSVLDRVYRWGDVLPSRDTNIHAVVVDNNFSLDGNMHAIARFLQCRFTVAIVLTEDGKGMKDEAEFPDCLFVQWAEPQCLRLLLERVVFGIYTERTKSQQLILF